MLRVKLLECIRSTVYEHYLKYLKGRNILNEKCCSPKKVNGSVAVQIRCNANRLCQPFRPIIHNRTCLYEVVDGIGLRTLCRAGNQIQTDRNPRVQSHMLRFNNIISVVLRTLSTGWSLRGRFSGSKSSSHAHRKSCVLTALRCRTKVRLIH